MRKIFLVSFCVLNKMLIYYLDFNFNYLLVLEEDSKRKKEREIKRKGSVIVLIIFNLILLWYLVSGGKIRS